MPQPRPTHAWAAENEPIPPGFPPPEVSYVLQVERGFLDDARYAIRDFLEARPSMSLDAVAAVAADLVDRARREWRCALVAATGRAEVVLDLRIDTRSVDELIPQLHRDLDGLAHRIYRREEVERRVAADRQKDDEIAELRATVDALRAELIEERAS